MIVQKSVQANDFAQHFSVTRFHYVINIADPFQSALYSFIVYYDAELVGFPGAIFPRNCYKHKTHIELTM